MGYLSRLTGRLDITPPIPWSRYRRSAFRPAGDGGDSNLSIRLEEAVKRIDTPDGFTQTQTAVAVVPRYKEPSKIYHLAEELQRLAEEFPDYSFNGYLVRGGEETGDIERHWIADGDTVLSEKAELRWPDGSPVELR